MSSVYRTVADYGTAEIEITRSRFIAYVDRAESEAQAVAFIEKIKKKHWDATHNCSAYVVGNNDQFQKADDDGEPSGTAGKPILEVIKKSGLKDTVIVITRYFGGTKLGAGGLVRAYGKAASAGLEAARIIERQLHTRIIAEIDYTLLGSVENNLRLHKYVIADKQFSATVMLTVLAKKGAEDELKKKFMDWTSGQVLLDRNGETYVDIDINTM